MSEYKSSLFLVTSTFVKQSIHMDPPTGCVTLKSNFAAVEELRGRECSREMKDTMERTSDKEQKKERERAEEEQRSRRRKRDAGAPLRSAPVLQPRRWAASTGVGSRLCSAEAHNRVERKVCDSPTALSTWRPPMRDRHHNQWASCVEAGGSAIQGWFSLDRLLCKI